MVYTQFQRFVVTILLFSLLLQSCGNPNWKIADEEFPRGTGAKTYHPAKVKQRSKSVKLATAESFTEGSSEHCRALSAALPSEHSPEAFSAASRARPPAPDSSSFTVPTSPYRTLPRSPDYSSRPSAEKEKLTSVTMSANKPRHVVLDKASTSEHAGSDGDQVLAPLTLHPLPLTSAHTTTVVQKPPTHAGLTVSCTLSSSSPLAPSYPSAQGHQVRFQEADGKWLAQVQDVWGRAQLLPVVCAPDQTSTQALQKLAGKAPGQHKYWVHVLNTHQPPWTPKVVYVGALGLRGGMPPKKAQECNYDSSKWKTNRDGSRTCPSGQHHVAAPRVSHSKPSPPPAPSIPMAPITPYSIGGGVSYDPVAMGNNLAGLLGSLFGSDDHGYREDPSVQQSIQRIKASTQKLERLNAEVNRLENQRAEAEHARHAAAMRASHEAWQKIHCYREDPSVQQTIQKIEESTQALRRKNAEVNRLENQRAEAEHARHAVAMRASDEAWQKIHEEQGEEKEKPYCRNLSVGAMREDIDYLRENLADYPELDSPLPREIEEDMHITLSHIAQEESELADFDRRIRDVPLGGGTQWSADYYNCRGAEQARAMLQSIKENIASIISERSVVLVNSEFASVREAACSVIQAIQANVSFRQSLQCAIEAYQKACAEHEEFQQLRSALTILEAQLTHDPTNAVLVEQFREQEAVFRQHPLYQEGVQLALAAQKLREDELAKAMHTMPSRFELKAGVVSQKLKQRTLHNQTAQAIRDELLQPVRAILARPSTPLRSRLAVQAAQGVAENVVDTAKLVVLAAKILGGSVHSLVTLKDKLGIGEKIRDYSALIKALFQKWQYEWENPAEYRLRLQTAQAYRTKLLLAEKALNAEVYHKRDAREVGYWSTEAIQWVFGGEIIKGAARVAGRSAEAIRASERVAQGIESSVKVVGRAVDAVMDAHDLADLLQQNMQLNEQEEGEEEDRKMPSLPRVTTFTTPAAAQEAVEAFLARWRLETPTGRVALQEQGKSLLKSVEVVKKSTKQSYRHQVLGFETQDVDPLVWNRVLQEQEATKVHLNAIRGLRSQLLEACQVHGQELQEVDILTTFDEDENEEVLYSSDEDEQ